MIDWRVADGELRRIGRARSGLELDEARWLIVGRTVQVHREAGYATYFEYLERVLGYDPHTARDRLRVADALVGLPRVRAKLASGELAYTAVRELTRVVRPDTEAAWVVEAVGKTVRQIEQMTAGRKPGDLPDTPADPDRRPRRLRLEVATDTYALFREARKMLEDERGERVSDDDVVRAMAEAVLRPGAAARKKRRSRPEQPRAREPFAHADGRPYGTPPPTSDDLPLIARTLEKMGFDRHASRRAVERAVAHVGRDAPLDQLVRAALREAS